MNTFKSKWLVGSMAAGMLALGSQAAVAGIAGSQHDFTPSGAAQGAGGSNVEICAFCHTPHAADASFVGAPLWNKSFDIAGRNYGGGESGRYSALSTSTLDGSEAVVGSVSLACLSCHDGSQAMDVVINAPGQDLGGGTYNPSGTIAAMTSGGLNSIAAIGADSAQLKNDHPISIEYAGGRGTTALPAGGEQTYSDFVDPDFNPMKSALKNSTQYWYFDDDSNNRIDKDEIRLYNRSDVAGADMPYVECGSCHDPHNTASNYDTGIATSADSLADGTTTDFLRKSNANSDICLTCHNK
ncbi:hypothetical protein [Motiliproteus sp. SC1-56]|uniref:hypothetical protein n=1 Tax=Motiliproteus sp. SC1-56 TaxID=2799565 RepID=UPI001A8EAF7F|nr:hypothetical protein [Motiliproteus sp. SC1-56]